MLDFLMMDNRAEWIRQTKKEPAPAEPGFSLRELMGLNGVALLGLFEEFPDLGTGENT